MSGAFLNNGSVVELKPTYVFRLIGKLDLLFERNMKMPTESRMPESRIKELYELYKKIPPLKNEIIVNTEGKTKEEVITKLINIVNKRVQ